MKMYGTSDRIINTSEAIEKDTIMIVTSDSQGAFKNISKKSTQSGTHKAKVEWEEENVQIFLDMYEDLYVNHCRSGIISQDNWRTLTEDFNKRANANPPYTVSQLRNKHDVLVRRYKAEKKKQDRFGEENSDWVYFDQLRRIRGETPKVKGVPKGKGVPGAVDGGKAVMTKQFIPGALDGGRPVMNKPFIPGAVDGGKAVVTKLSAPGAVDGGKAFVTKLIVPGALDGGKGVVTEPIVLSDNEKVVDVNELFGQYSVSSPLEDVTPTSERSKEEEETAACKLNDVHGKPNRLKRKRKRRYSEIGGESPDSRMKLFIHVMKDFNREYLHIERMKLDLLKEMLELKKREFEWKSQRRFSNSAELEDNGGN